MKITEFYKSGKPVFSFEFFPPKTEAGEALLFQEIQNLKALSPSFVSVTYGAMGTTRDNTLRIVTRIKNEIGLEAAAHLTCIAHTRDEIERILDDLKAQGIENIVALRGDRPKDAAGPKNGGLVYAADLVRYIRGHARHGKSFSLAVAGYPEGHVECPDKEKDLDHLKAKVDAGADVIITQLFFSNRDYFDFVEKAKKRGIRVPVVAGIMPLTNASQMQRFSEMCGAKIPAEMKQAIERLEGDQPAVEAYGIEYATRQCRELLQGGAPGLHFYTLNKSNATREIYLNLGLPSQR